MSEKINEILARVDRYRGKAAAIKAGRYTADVDTLMAQLHSMNNELCYKCGRYTNAHLGACDGCRWKIGKDGQ